MTPDPNKREAMPLPCPFCGHSGLSFREGETFRWRVASCEACGATCSEVRVQTLGEGTKEQWELNARNELIEEWNTRAPERDAEAAVMNCAFDPESVEFTPAEWLALNTQKADRITELERELASVTAEKEAETKAVLECARAMRLMQDQLTAAESERDALRKALGEIKAMQPEALEKIKHNGFVFEDIGCEPGNWQHLAFTLYTSLCEANHIAASSLGAMGVEE